MVEQPTLETNIWGTAAVYFSKILTARLDQAILQMAVPVHKVPNRGGSAAAALKIAVLLRVVTCTKLSVTPCDSVMAPCELQLWSVPLMLPSFGRESTDMPKYCWGAKQCSLMYNGMNQFSSRMVLQFPVMLLFCLQLDPITSEDHCVEQKGATLQTASWF